MENNENQRRFTSWKEIAQYLGRDIRTCQRWEEKFGLPVYRVDPESPKSRVYAFKDELDEWLHQRKPPRTPIANAFLWLQTFKKRLLYLGLPALAGIIVILALFIPRLLGPSDPADFRIEGSKLVVLNAKGKELWHYETGLQNLVGETKYRESFQFRRLKESADRYLMPTLIMKDINADRRIEVLFSTQTEDEMGEGELICFNDRGAELWRFKAGREMKFGSTVYSPDYRICGFDTYDVDNDGQLEIFISSLQIPHWPTQLVSLSSQGRMLGEYWHSGYLNDFVFADLDKDGQTEIIFAGLNNEYRKACLIVFDAGNLNGSSPQTESEFRCPELGPGSEKYYILFPRTDFDMIANPVEAVERMNILQNGYLSLSTSVSKIIYILNSGLAVESVIFSHGFIQLHSEAVREGKIKSTLDEKYRENLKKGVVYFDGQKWVNWPTPTGFLGETKN